MNRAERRWYARQGWVDAEIPEDLAVLLEYEAAVDALSRHVMRPELGFMTNQSAHTEEGLALQAKVREYRMAVLEALRGTETRPVEDEA